MSGVDRRVAVVVFDLDGTLLDSDRALVDAFVALGVDESIVTFGHVVADECARLGIELDDYLAAYDVEAADPYPGVDPMLAELDRWAVCSNKTTGLGQAELDRCGWAPEVAMFAERFVGPKRLEPVLAALGVEARRTLFVGDTAHDRRCAEAAGAAFALAAWNPRAVPMPGDLVLGDPADLLTLLT